MSDERMSEHISKGNSVMNADKTLWHRGVDHLQMYSDNILCLPSLKSLLTYCP